MKSMMYFANRTVLPESHNVSVTVSSCYNFALPSAHAALVACAVFFALAGAIISTSICAAIISIIIPIIISICIIAIMQQQNSALSEFEPI